MEAGEEPGLPLKTDSVSCGFKPRATCGEGALPRVPAATLAHVTVSSLTQMTTVHIWRPTNQWQQAYLVFTWQTSACGIMVRNQSQKSDDCQNILLNTPQGWWEHPVRAGVRGGLLHKLACWNHRHEGTWRASCLPASFPRREDCGPRGAVPHWSHRLAVGGAARPGPGSDHLPPLSRVPHFSRSLPVGTWGIISQSPFILRS